MYHSTRRENIEKILREGLKISKPRGSAPGSQEPGVYLSRFMFEWQFWETLDRVAGAVLEIDVSGLELLQDPEHGNSKFSRVPIPSERIKKVWVSTDQDPMTFKELIYK